MRTTTEINEQLFAIGQELQTIDLRRAELKREQESLWAERARAEAVEDFVRLAKSDRDAFETAVVSDDLVRAEVAAAEAAAELEAAKGNEEAAPGVVDGNPSTDA